MKLINNDIYLLLIDEEAEIMYNDLCYDIYGSPGYNNIKYVIRCLRSANDSYWNKHTSKIIAYRKLNSEAKELDLPLLPPFEREIDINEIAKQRAIDRKWHPNSMETRRVGNEIIEAVKYGYEIAQSKQFSLDDMKKAIEMAREYEFIRFGGGDIESKYTEEEIIQSLSTQQLPKEFVISDKFSTFEENIKNAKYKS